MPLDTDFGLKLKLPSQGENAHLYVHLTNDKGHF